MGLAWEDPAVALDDEECLVLHMIDEASMVDWDLDGRHSGADWQHYHLKCQQGLLALEA